MLRASACKVQGAVHAAPRLAPQSADVPKLFKHSGKLRNKHLSKRDTEKLVKEIWRERMADPGGGPG